MYLSAMPSLAESLATDATRVQLTLSAFFLGLSMGQVFYGSLADRYGRRPLLLIGMLLFIVASTGCAMATSVEALIVWRFLQAAGACAGMVITNAVVRDRFNPIEGAHMISRMMLVMGAAPILAPLLGGFILTTLGWEAIFWALALYGVVLLVAIVVAALLVKWDRSPDDTTHPNGAHKLSSLRDVYELVLVRRWSPVATGAIVGGIGIAAYLRTTPLGVTSQLSTLSRSYLDAQNALPEVLHGIDMMRGCVALVTTAITNNGWLVIGFVAASLAAAVGGGRFKMQKPTIGNSVTALVGGVLLGWGSLTALGCTVGVLLSGTQAFAVSGIVFLVVVAFAVWAGTKLRLHRLFGA